MTRLVRRTTMRPRRAAVVLAACLAVAGLSGCAEERLGSAAVIDDRTISTDELQSATQAYLKVVPEGEPGRTQVALLQREIVSSVLDEVAQEHDVRVREGRVAAERDDVLQSVGGRKGLIRTLAQGQPPTVLAPDDVDRWFKDRLLFNGIAADICDCPLDPNSQETQQAFMDANDELRKASADMDIEVNPRYGTWDPDEGITPLVSGGLSKTVDELTGAES